MKVVTVIDDVVLIQRGPARSPSRWRDDWLVLVAGLVVFIIVLGLVLFVGARIAGADHVGAGRGHQQTDTWRRLAQCESGGDWQDRHGPYEGGVHFHHKTWDNYRRADMPTSADRAHVFAQVWVAERVLAAEGWAHAWPTCSRKIGMR